MTNDDDQILVPRGRIKAESWRITHPHLKLALKYGIGDEGPWKPILSNWSVMFDSYALRRGPAHGLPNLADFAVTQLMNSRISSRDLRSLGSWLSVDANRAKLKTVQDALRPFPGLHAVGTDGMRAISDLIEGMLREDDEHARRALFGIGRAKIFKWLSAWAPAHVPMIDAYVASALTDMEGRSSNISVQELLTRFQRLLNLKDNFRVLGRLGDWLHGHLRLELPQQVPPVRVLDSLLWCDWWAFWRKAGDFTDWVISEDKRRTDYELQEKGRRLSSRLV